MQISYRLKHYIKPLFLNLKIYEMSNKIDLNSFKITTKRKLTTEQKLGKESSEDDLKTTCDDIVENKISKRKSPNKSPKKPKLPPPNWEEVLENIREMRKVKNAPVDNMGCDKCQDEEAESEVMRYQCLLSLMLSSQTKDEITYAAMQKLREHGCTVDSIINTSDEKLGELIYPASFWKNKVKFIKKSSQMIKDKFNGDIPKTVEELCSLPGVGPKMAHICMRTAWGELTGIGVDTHVHRISNRLGWVSTKQPEQTRKDLEDWLPRELWSEVNELLVGFGQQICKSVKPNCAECLNKSLCPFGKSNVKSGKKSKSK